MNVLLVGTDGRDRITEEERQKYRLGGAPCHCTDTIMLVHLSADRERASVVSLPRDTYAETPRAHRPRPPATAHGPSGQAERRLRGGRARAHRADGRAHDRVKIDHYLEVDFTSFMRTVDVARRGADLHGPAAEGLATPASTCRPAPTELDGGQALQYVRSRHVDGASDLGRMQRQQRFMAALIEQATGSGVLLNPVRFRRRHLDRARARSAPTRGSARSELLDLGQAMRGLHPASSEFTSVPIGQLGYAVKGIGSTVKWDAGEGRSGSSRPCARTGRSPRTAAARRRAATPRRRRPAADPGPGRQRHRARTGSAGRWTRRCAPPASAPPAPRSTREPRGLTRTVVDVRPALGPLGQVPGGRPAGSGAAGGDGAGPDHEGDRGRGLRKVGRVRAEARSRGEFGDGDGRPGGVPVGCVAGDGAMLRRRRPPGVRPGRTATCRQSTSKPSATRFSRSSLIARRRARRWVRRICASW